MTRDPTDLELYLTHRPALLERATPIVGCRTQAEDLVQEAFLRFAVGERDGQAARIGNPTAYLFRIVRNLAVDWVRSRRRDRGQVDAEEMERVPAPAADPERAALHREELRIVAAALDELPERTRIAFEMHRLGGHTFHEIAGRLGISVSLAHKLVHDALAHCTARLSDGGG